MRVLVLTTTALVATAASAERIELSDGDMTISAPAAVDCAAPPDFTLQGAGPALFADNRTALDTLVAQMASGLAASCENLDTVTVTGEERSIRFSFEVTRDNGWRLDGPVTAEPEPTPAVAAVPAAAPSPDAPAAEPEAPAEPEIAPGLDFQTFTSIFGSVPTVRGHVAFDNSEIWARVMAARMYARNPGLLANDSHAIELLGQMATQPEYVQVLGPLAAKQPRQMSVFERRDVAQRIRTQLAAGLDARRQTGPILVYNTVQLRLGEYDFNTATFPLPSVEQVRNHRSVGWKNATVQNAFANVVLPDRLRATQDQARQLDAYLRSRGDTTLYLAVFAEIDPEVPRSLSDHGGGYALATNTKVTQVALFADRGLSQVLYDFTPDLAAAQAQADVAAAALTRALSTGEDAVKAIDAINGTSTAAVAVADIFAAQNWGQTNETPEARRATAMATFEAASADRMMRLAGNLRIGTYDPVRKVLPIQSLGLQGLQFTTIQTNANLQANLIPNLTEIPVDSETAARITQGSRNGTLEFRLDAELMQGAHQSQGTDYVQLTAILKPEKLQLFAGPQNYNRAPREMVLDLELPDSVSSVPSLMDALSPSK